jgi:hypothetical protein
LSEEVTVETESLASSACEVATADFEGQEGVFVFEVDEVEYQHTEGRITGGEIAILAGITAQEGLTKILPDGRRETVRFDEVVELLVGVQFKSRPRFKRG